MSDPLIRAMDHYVILEPGGSERLADRTETLAWLEAMLNAMEVLPADLQPLADASARAARLLDTACELDIAPGRTVQWYAVRMEPGGAA